MTSKKIKWNRTPENVFFTTTHRKGEGVYNEWRDRTNKNKPYCFCFFSSSLNKNQSTEVYVLYVLSSSLMFFFLVNLRYVSNQ